MMMKRISGTVGYSRPLSESHVTKCKIHMRNKPCFHSLFPSSPGNNKAHIFYLIKTDKMHNCTEHGLFCSFMWSVSSISVHWIEFSYKADAVQLGRKTWLLKKEKIFVPFSCQSAPVIQMSGAINPNIVGGVNKLYVLFEGSGLFRVMRALQEQRSAVGEV